MHWVKVIWAKDGDFWTTQGWEISFFQTKHCHVRTIVHPELYIIQFWHLWVKRWCQVVVFASKEQLEMTWNKIKGKVRVKCWSVPLMYDDGAGQPTRIIRCKLSENIFRHMELATLLSSLRVCFRSTLGLGRMTMIISIWWLFYRHGGPPAQLQVQLGLWSSAIAIFRIHHQTVIVMLDKYRSWCDNNLSLS